MDDVGRADPSPNDRHSRLPIGALPRPVLVLSVVAFCVAVGFGLVVPALPLFARDFGANKAAVGAVISTFAAMRLAAALGVGKVVDILGERVVLALGIAIVAVSSAATGFSENYLQLLVLRGAGGIGSAMFTVSALALVLRVSDVTVRGRAAGIFQGGFLLGGIFGPVLGGPLISWSIRAPFFCYAGTLVVAGGVGLIGLRQVERPPRIAPHRRSALSRGGGRSPMTDSAPRMTIGTALRQRPYQAALAANAAISWAALGVRNSLIPLFVIEALHAPAVWIGVGLTLMAAANAAVLLPAGRSADRRGRRSLLVAGCAVSGVALVMLAVMGHIAGYLAAMVVFGVGSGLLDVAPAAIVGDIAGGRGGTVVAGYQMAGDLGSVLGPVTAGWIADAAGDRAAFWTTAVVLLGAALLGVSASETRKISSGHAMETH